MWSQCVWLKRMLAPMGTRAVSASPSGRAPVPQSKMKTCPAPVRTSTHAVLPPKRTVRGPGVGRRSEEHTSELQSLTNLVCRLLLEKKKNTEKHKEQTKRDQ